MKYNQETNKIVYVCLSSECNKHKMTEIGEYTDIVFCEGDIAFTDRWFNKERFNNDMLI